MEISDIKKDGGSGGMIGINLGVYCNQNCTFCLVGHGREDFPALRKEDAMKVVKGYLDQGYGYGTVMFTGGEPTLNPDFFEIVSETLADPRVSHINLMTNGSKLTKDLFDKLTEIDKEKKISYSFSLHADTPELSKLITRDDGSGFDGTCKAIKMTSEAGFVTDVAIIILEQNYKTLPDYARFMVKNFPKIAGVSFGYPILCGNAMDNKDWIYAKFGDISGYLGEAIEILMKAGIRPVTAAGAPFPLCSVPGVEEVVVRPFIEWQKQYVGTATNGRLTEYKYEDDRLPKEKLEICKECVLNAACIGLYKTYIEMFGGEGISPVKIETYKGPIFRSKNIDDIADDLSETKLNLVILDDDSQDKPGMYEIGGKKMTVAINKTDYS